MRSCNALKMRCASDGRAAQSGTTLVELTMATALMAVIFAAVMPLFVGIRNSADTRWAGLEMVQNARVLNEQLCRYLTQARRVVAVSASMEQRGAIEFEMPGGAIYRCAMGPRGYIEFGPVGTRHELAGPVEYLRFACYGETDFDTPVRTPDAIRLVTWEAGLKSGEQPVRRRSVVGACCLRGSPMPTNSDSGASLAAQQ
jgi:hypothetical protein